MPPPLTVQKFQEALKKSRIEKFLNKANLKEINAAIANGDIIFLATIFAQLEKLNQKNKKSVENFAVTKKSFLKEFELELKRIKKEYLTKPRTKKIQKIEAKEKIEAEKLLENIP